MRRALAVVAGLALALPASAGAAGGLTPSKALAQANKAAAARARSQHDIAAWEISRGFRLTSTQFVFVWYGQLKNGRGCGAQLVVRAGGRGGHGSSTSFRNEECS